MNNIKNQIDDFLKESLFFKKSILYTKDFYNEFGLKQGDYWIQKLKKENIIWKFERDLFVFSKNGIYDAIEKYMNYKDADYYFGGLSLFSSYGLTTQISNVINIFNNKVRTKQVFNGSYIKFTYDHNLNNKGIIRNENGYYSINKERFLFDFVEYGLQYLDIKEIRDFLLYFNPSEYNINIIKKYGKYSSKINLQKIAGIFELKGINPFLIIDKKDLQTTKKLLFKTNIGNKLVLPNSCIILDFYL